jgi:plasmid segregation protein ParM
MVVIGIDPGYSYLKDSQFRIFPSLMSSEESAVSRAYKVDIGGKVYYVGVGRGSMDVTRFDSELTKVLILTDLYYAGAADYQIVTGLPIAQFQNQKESYKKSIEKYARSEVNGKIITIQDVTIFPQAAGALYAANVQNDCIVIDIGGRTTDIGLFQFMGGKFTLVRSNTLYCGAEGLYSDIVRAVNGKFNLALENWQGESILRNGLSLDGIKQDTSFLHPIISAYFEPVCKEIELKYAAVHTIETLLCGGGANSALECIRKVAPNIKIMNNSQFSNAAGFYNVGRSVYGRN